MDIVMQHTITDSLNDGRTRQEFLAGQRYDVPVHIGQLWIGRGWARAAVPEPAKKFSERNGNRV